VLYAAAGRASEVAQLTRANVKDGKATAIEIGGKGGKRRPLLLTEAAQKAIRAYLEARGEDDHAAGLFISHGRSAGQPLTPTIWSIVNDDARDVFGVDPRAVRSHGSARTPSVTCGRSNW
jgi:site-specific recombinase XerD